MNIQITNRPSFALAVVHLAPGEEVVAESGAMVSKDTTVEMTTSTRSQGKKKGVMSGLIAGAKRMIAGESFFLNTFTGTGEVTFAPTFPGDIEQYTLKGNSLMVQSKSYLCSDSSVTVDTKWGGSRTFFGGEGLIMLKASGSGTIAFNAFGGVQCVEVNGNFIVDTGHIVAFEDSLTFNVKGFGGGLKSLIFGGEGLVCNFTGTGKVWIQTRNPVEFGSRIGGRLPPRS